LRVGEQALILRVFTARMAPDRLKNQSTPTEHHGCTTFGGPSRPSPTHQQSAPPVTYEAGLKELEALVRAAPSLAPALDELLTTTAARRQPLTFCRDKLQAIETQVSRGWTAC
jgi:exodeoxyribonuclease VII small subunit